METWIARWGLIAVFFGAATEGDVTMILTGFVSHLGLLDFPVAIAIGALGAVISDATWYGLARWKADALRSSALYRRVGPYVETIADRIGPKQILVCRFIYGTRVPTLIYWALRGVSVPRLLVYLVPGCLAWAAAVGCAGYLLSGTATQILGKVRHAEHWLLGAFLAATALVVALHLLARVRRRRRTLA